jgi:hypothetical protein
MNKRFIKPHSASSQDNDIINLATNSQLLHPVTLDWINNSNSANPICLTKVQFKDNKYLSNVNNYKCKSNIDNYKKYMYVPPIGISSNDILQIYEINSIDSLHTWITSNIDILTYYTINRVLNCWIKSNYDTLKIYNNFLEKIYNKLLLKYLNLEILKQIKNETIDINKDIKYYIDYWIEKNNTLAFSFNLLDDMILYVQKKYK